MKNKNIIIFYLLLLIILIVISRTLIKKQKPNSFDSQLIKSEYYNKKYKTRYINYYKNNKSLNINQLIINVNIGLDYPFYENIKKTDLTKNNLILVNKYNYLEKTYIPNNLEILDEQYANKNMKLSHPAKVAFEELSKNAKKENLNIIAMSTYRSYTYQNTLYNNYVIKDGKTLADTYSARPGHSEHQTALAIDVYNKSLSYTEFEQTKEFIWIKENAHKYGFILRYPKGKEHITGYQYEPWHYRYIGIDEATYIYNHNITFEEYYAKFIENKK